MPRLALVVAASVLGALGGAGAAIAFDPHTAPPPFSQRCYVTLKGHEDGSASLYCGAAERAFGAVDAETGRVRLRVPR
jgi:hypothetical protein